MIFKSTEPKVVSIAPNYGGNILALSLLTIVIGASFFLPSSEEIDEATHSISYRDLIVNKFNRFRSYFVSFFSKSKLQFQECLSHSCSSEYTPIKPEGSLTHIRRSSYLSKIGGLYTYFKIISYLWVAVDLLQVRARVPTRISDGLLNHLRIPIRVLRRCDFTSYLLLSPRQKLIVNSGIYVYQLFEYTGYSGDIVLAYRHSSSSVINLCRRLAPQVVPLPDVIRDYLSVRSPGYGIKPQDGLDILDYARMLHVARNAIGISALFVDSLIALVLGYCVYLFLNKHKFIMSYINEFFSTMDEFLSRISSVYAYASGKRHTTDEFIYDAVDIKNITPICNVDNDSVNCVISQCENDMVLDDSNFVFISNIVPQSGVRRYEMDSGLSDDDMFRTVSQRNHIQRQRAISERNRHREESRNNTQSVQRLMQSQENTTRVLTEVADTLAEVALGTDTPDVTEEDVDIQSQNVHSECDMMSTIPRVDDGLNTPSDTCALNKDIPRLVWNPSRAFERERDNPDSVVLEHTRDIAFVMGDFSSFKELFSAYQGFRTVIDLFKSDHFSILGTDLIKLRSVKNFHPFPFVKRLANDLCSAKWDQVSDFARVRMMYYLLNPYCTDCYRPIWFDGHIVPLIVDSLARKNANPKSDAMYKYVAMSRFDFKNSTIEDWDNFCIRHRLYVESGEDNPNFPAWFRSSHMHVIAHMGDFSPTFLR